MSRGRRNQPPPKAGARFNDIQPDPSRIGGVAEAPFARLPDPATLFIARSERLTELAKGHTLSAYLSFLADVARAQAGAVASLPPPEPVPAEQIALRAQNGFPPISADQVHGSAAFAATLMGLLDRVALDAAPEATRAAIAALRAMPSAEQFALAADILQGAYALDRVAESLFLAAALQVHLSRLAAQLDATALTPVAEGVCPVCGSAPVSSVVVGWTQASKARYCACSLCGTLWNHVRIKCTACGSTEGIAYHTMESETGEDGTKTIGIESCTSCRSYIKHLQQHEDPRLDPIADDVASYALDLLASREDFRRAGVNPLFLVG